MELDLSQWTIEVDIFFVQPNFVKFIRGGGEL